MKTPNSLNKKVDIKMSNELPTFNPTSILLTGSGGFIGSVLLDEVVFTFPDAHIVVLDIFDYMASIKNLEFACKLAGTKLNKETFETTGGRLTLVCGDFCEKGLVRHILRVHQIDTIYHIGAMTHVDASFGNSLKFTQVNVVGTHVMLECAREYGKIKRFIHCSTDETYGESKGNGEHVKAFNEESAFEPSNPYAASKVAAEALAVAYFHSYKLPVIITRGNNTYGGRQFPEKCIPRFLSLIKQGKPITVHGSGEQLRSFLHVQDVADAFITILKHGVVGEAYNIGTRFEISIQKLAELLLTLHGKDPAKHIIHTKDRNFNDRRYYITNEKLKALGWKPTITFEEGIRRTIRWYEDHDIYEYWAQAQKAFEESTGYFTTA